MKMKVFLLQHVHALSNGDEDVKVIGVYSSEDKARLAIARLSSVPGFSGAAGGFHVDVYELDQDGWREGFVTAS